MARRRSRKSRRMPGDPRSVGRGVRILTFECVSCGNRTEALLVPAQCRCGAEGLWKTIEEETE